VALSFFYRPVQRVLELLQIRCSKKPSDHAREPELVQPLGGSVLEPVGAFQEQ
jgi:hypothetical protein